MYIQPDYRGLLQLLPFSFKSEKAMLGYEVLKYIKAFRNTTHISYEPLETVWNSKVCLIPLLFLLLQRETYLNISGIVHGAPVTCNVSTHF